MELFIGEKHSKFELTSPQTFDGPKKPNSFRFRLSNIRWVVDATCSAIEGVKAQAHDYFSFKDGYDTIIGEKGSCFRVTKTKDCHCSGDYRTPCYLIFDDSTSALDLSTGRYIKPCQAFYMTWPVILIVKRVVMPNAPNALQHR